jgi:hypothetical protein
LVWQETLEGLRNTYVTIRYISFISYYSISISSVSV